jgi:Fe-S-cluster-containing hydrogenase component 2
MDVLRMSANGRRAEIRWAEDCQVCRLCQVYCPVDAITITDDRAVVPVMTAWG